MTEGWDDLVDLMGGVYAAGVGAKMLRLELTEVAPEHVTVELWELDRESKTGSRLALVSGSHAWATRAIRDRITSSERWG